MKRYLKVEMRSISCLRRLAAAEHLMSAATRRCAASHVGGDSPLAPFQFEAVDRVGKESTHFRGGRHHRKRHRLANLVVACARLLCTCKVAFSSVAAPGDRGGGKKHQLACLRVERAGDILEPHEGRRLFRIFYHVDPSPLKNRTARLRRIFPRGPFSPAAR